MFIILYFYQITFAFTNPLTIKPVMSKKEILMEVYRNFTVRLKVNSVLYDFKDILCDVKTRLLDTYCLDLYGSQLWNYNKHDVNHFYVAWRKTVRRLWKIPTNNPRKL